MASNNTGYLKFESAGRTIDVTPGAAFKVLNVDGMGTIESSFQSLISPYIPGEELINQHDEARILAVDMRCPNEFREYVITFFTSGAMGRLTVNWNGVTRYIDYVVINSKILQKTINYGLTINLSLKCTDVYWNDMDDFNQDIADKVKLYATPFVWLAGEDYVVDYNNFNREVALSNHGHVPIGLKATLIARGNVKNPSIFMDRGPFIRVLVDMVSADRLEISTMRRQKYVRLNGENILRYTDQMSTYIEIPPGTHYISYAADDGAENLEVYISRRPQYWGV